MVSPDSDTEVVLDDLIFGEAPRWHEGRLWFSDFFRHVVRTFDPTSGLADVVASVPAQPSGLGWLPDGRLLVVSMRDRKVLRLEPEGDVVEHADLTSIAGGECNDMVVDHVGRAYVGNFGSDVAGGEEIVPTVLALVHPHGEVEVAAEGLLFPNGSVLTPDGSTLIVAETFGCRLTAFDIDADGRLSGRRTWADLGEMHPDGCCLDDAGGMWVAVPPARECLRVEEGGRITDRVSTTRPCIACALGGDDRRTLYLMTTWFSDAPSRPDGDPIGVIEAVRVLHPGAGRP